MTVTSPASAAAGLPASGWPPGARPHAARNAGVAVTPTAAVRQNSARREQGTPMRKTALGPAGADDPTTMVDLRLTIAGPPCPSAPLPARREDRCLQSWER